MVVLSDEVYQEIVEYPIPTDLEAVKVFASAPAVLDLVMWLTYRCFVAKSEERIPLSGGFRPDCTAWMRRILPPQKISSHARTRTPGPKFNRLEQTVCESPETLKSFGVWPQNRDLGTSYVH